MDPDQTADAQAGLDPCWSQTHYVGFVMRRLKLRNQSLLHTIKKFNIKILKFNT
jgi:hypothetical protein